MLQHGLTLRILCQLKPAKHRRENIVRFHLYQLPRIGKFIETESRIVHQDLGEGVLGVNV